MKHFFTVIFCGLCALLLVIALLLWSFNFRFNLSSSMPQGFYREVVKSLQVGDLVEVCLPVELALFAKTRHYIGAGQCPGEAQPLLKEVVAVAGDKVTVTRKGVAINGKLLPHSILFTRDSKQRPLISQVANLSRVLQKNELWLYGTDDPLSWDSRYFGTLQRNTVRLVVQAVWVW